MLGKNLVGYTRGSGAKENLVAVHGHQVQVRMGQAHAEGNESNTPSIGCRLKGRCEAPGNVEHSVVGGRVQFVDGSGVMTRDHHAVPEGQRLAVQDDEAPPLLQQPMVGQSVPSDGAERALGVKVSSGRVTRQG